MQRELLAFPMIPRVPRNVIQIQVVAGAGTVTPVPQFLLAVAATK